MRTKRSLGRAQRRIGGDAGIAVGAAALQRQHQLGGRHGLADRALAIGSMSLMRIDAGRDGLLGAAGFLDRQGAEDVALLDAIGSFMRLIWKPSQPRPTTSTAAMLGLQA
jgi:hypothetical protein